MLKCLKHLSSISSAASEPLWEAFFGPTALATYMAKPAIQETMSEERLKKLCWSLPVAITVETTGSKHDLWRLK